MRVLIIRRMHTDTGRIPSLPPQAGATALYRAGPQRMRSGLAISLVFGMSLLGCDRFAPEDAVAFDPPATYRVWWEKTERCSGAQASFERIRWYVVAGDGFDCPSGRCAGRWEDDHTIYIAEAWRDHEMVVRHEMLHDLIDHAGHPAPPFGAPCPLTWSTWTGSGAAVRRAGDGGAMPRID